MSKQYVELLKHILDECNFIQETISPDISISEFLDKLLSEVSKSLVKQPRKYLQILNTNGKRLNGKIWLECVIN